MNTSYEFGHTDEANSLQHCTHGERSYLLHTAVHSTESLLFSVLLQLTIILAVSRAASSLAVRIGQSRAVGELIVGILPGPSLFGSLAPGAFTLVFRSA